MSRFLTAAAGQVAELAEHAAEEGRLSRGRALFRKGSVSDLTVVEGSVVASVRGSKGDDYQTTISTALAPPGVRREVTDGWRHGQSVDDLIGDGIDVCPREIDLAFACDCADWDEPCKHVVALFLALADRVDLDEAELLRWRGLGAAASEAGAKTGSGAEAPSSAGSSHDEPDAPTSSVAGPRVSAQPRSMQRGGRPGASEAGDETDGGDRTARLSELESLLGDTVVRVPAADATEAEPASSALEPALAEFLGVGTELDPIDVSNITALPPLFTSVELGALADLGPVLADALATITASLEQDTSP